MYRLVALSMVLMLLLPLNTDSKAEDMQPVTISELPMFMESAQERYAKLQNKILVLIEAAEGARVNTKLKSTSYTMRRDKPRYIFPSKKQKEWVIIRLEQSLNECREYVYTPVLPFKDEMKVGQLGELDQRDSTFKVMQVIDDQNALISWEKKRSKLSPALTGAFHISHVGQDFGYARHVSIASGRLFGEKEGIGGNGTCLFWLSGPTTGYVDDSKVSLEGVFEISGTHRYATVTGAPKTVYKLKKFELEPHLPAPENEIEELPSHNQKEAGFEIREWKDTSGKFRIDAKLVSVSNDAVVLLKQDGKKITVPLATFSREDISYLSSIASEKTPASHRAPGRDQAGVASEPMLGLVNHYSLDKTTADQGVLKNHGKVISGSYASDRKGHDNACFQTVIENSGNQGGIITTKPGPIGVSPRTISCWFQTSVQTPQEIISYGSSDGAGRGDKFQVFLSYGKSGLTASVGNSAITYNADFADGKWHHCVFVLPKRETPTTGDIKVFFDGAEISTAANTLVALVPDQPINTGASPLVLASQFSGKLDEVRVYSRALSANEINRLSRDK